MEISAALVQELRNRTQAGMMECKRALVASKGDIEAAILEIRKTTGHKAEKTAGRIAAEGLVDILCAPDGKKAVILEVNCETDFVAREQKFKHFSQEALKQALTLEDKPESLALLQTAMEQQRLELVAQLGEKISIRRLAIVQTSEGVIGTYVHGGAMVARIASLVLLKEGTAEVARNVAMHVAALAPRYLMADLIPESDLATERSIAEAEFEKSGQAANFRESIINGKLKKWMSTVVLLEQIYAKDPTHKTTVKAFLNANHAVIESFVRFEVGEGIEKKADDFVTEVMAQASA